MENFKDKLKVQNISNSICIVILALFNIFRLFSQVGLIPNLLPAVNDDRWVNAWNGFATGSTTTMLGFMIVTVIRNMKALKDEKALKKLYVKDTDERMNQISLSAQSAASQLMLRLEIVAIFVASYVNLTVGLTILACACAHALCILGFKAYYRWKY
jgi:uncharacterized membrane protein